MKKNAIFVALAAVLLLSGCGNFNTSVADDPWGNVNSQASNAEANLSAADSPAVAIQPETPEETYTSTKTGNTFTVPENGRANVLCNETKEMTVPSEDGKMTLTEYVKNDNVFSVYIDGLTTDSDVFIQFFLRSQNDWNTETTYQLVDMKGQDCNYIMQQGFFTSKGYDYSFSWEQYGNVFDDAQFTIIDFSPLTGEMKWYFYVEMSGSGDTSIVEGVAHTVAGEEPSAIGNGGSGESAGGDSGSDGLMKPGERKCAVCQGKGKVPCKKCTNGFLQCPSCHGAKTYYSYAEKKDVVCPRCNGGGEIKCTASGCVGGYVKCTHCDGDGYN